MIFQRIAVIFACSGDAGGGVFPGNPRKTGRSSKHIPGQARKWAGKGSGKPWPVIAMSRLSRKGRAHCGSVMASCALARACDKSRLSRSRPRTGQAIQKLPIGNFHRRPARRIQKIANWQFFSRVEIPDAERRPARRAGLLRADPARIPAGPDCHGAGSPARPSRARGRARRTPRPSAGPAPPAPA